MFQSHVPVENPVPHSSPMFQLHKESSPAIRDTPNHYSITHTHKSCNSYVVCLNILQVAELASLAQLLPPRSPTVRNPAPDSFLCRQQSCSPIASASAAAPGPDCGIHFNCCSPFASAAAPRLRLLLAACIRFSCCSRSRPLLPDCVRFDCCSPITSASTAAPRLRLLDSSPCPDRTFLAEFEVQ